MITTSLQPWQERVIEEKAELDNKLMKLIEFLKSDAFQDLPLVNIRCLRRQRMVMELYSDILNERISLFLEV